MANSSNAVPLQVEYDPKKRRISLNRIFQIPQMFRPAASVFFANTLGRLNLDRPAIGLTAIAGWFRFSRWRRQHAVAHPVDGERHDRRWLYKLVIAKENVNSAPIDFWEFGVFKGESIFWWVDHVSNPESRFVGFDTFTGLPERWRATEPKGAFNVYGRIPETSDPRCSFQAGLFQDTLLPFIHTRDFLRRLVIHLDADLFSSTLYVLTTLARHFKPGDIIFFDNFICSLDEFRAFEDWVRSFRVNYEVLGEVDEYIRVCVKIA
jgi:O-methyltransferase